jgi:hypothetical protein
LPARRYTAAAVASAAIILGASTVSAHRLDECLQATRIAVELQRIDVEVSLTPGVEVADAIIGEIDSDGDQSFSIPERHAFAGRVLMNLDLSHDGRAAHVVGGAATFPPIDAFRRGEGTIHLRATATLPPQAAGAHHVSFRNGYRPEISVYLANALVPVSDRVAVTAQRRDPTQRELTIDYTIDTRGSAPRSAWLLGGVVVALGLLLIRR